jgi:hypothetical protein
VEFSYCPGIEFSFSLTTFFRFPLPVRENGLKELAFMFIAILSSEPLIIINDELVSFTFRYGCENGLRAK